jgi:hypothetical protein
MGNENYKTREGGHGAYRAIRRAPHLLQLELFHARFVRRDRRALDADVVLEDCFGRLDRHTVIGLWVREWRTGQSMGGSKIMSAHVETTSWRLATYRVAML